MALALPSSQIEALDAEVIVADANRSVVNFMASWPAWPRPAAALIGAGGVGKSCLARLWSRRAGAQWFAGVEDDIEANEAIAALTQGQAVVVDDGDRWFQRGGETAPAALFHLLNLADERRVGLLLTMRAPPERWGVARDDLRSRLNALARLPLPAPDDALLRALLVKAFGRCGVAVSADAVAYLARRIERTGVAASRVAVAVDAAARADGVKITRTFIARFLDGADF